MIKRIVLMAIGIMVSGLACLNAQVDNYALRLSPNGYVNCGAMPELDGKTSYTLQFWMNADAWTAGATVLSRGNGMSAVISADKEITFKVGESALKATSADLKAGAWNQVTLLCDNGSAKVYVNQSVVATGVLDAMPQSDASFVIGGGSYQGRVDELRVWNDLLSSDFNYFFNNTLNKWCPQWDNLVAYYKFDQNLCVGNVVDYKTVTLKNASYNHHGIFSTTGASREKVEDNPRLPYLINGAYTNNSRFYDRAIDKEKYLLSNDLIILGIQSYNDGHLKYLTPCNHATVINGGYLAEYEGRTGVLSLNGEGAKMECTKDVLLPTIDVNGRASAGYTFETWIYLEEWTEGAYLFRKETADGLNGFSISLGAEDTKQVIVKVNGKKYVNVNNMSVGKWVHFGVSVNASGITRTTFLFTYDGVAKWANAAVSDGDTNYTPTGMDDCVAYVGENLKAKLDGTAVWNIKYAASDIASHMNAYTMPGIGVSVTADMMQKANSLWLYDNPDNVGYDTYSQDEWKRIMESAYEGYRGYKIRISVQSHTGWLNTISDAAKRKIFAADLAELSKNYDGVELDLEWADGDNSWSIYGLLADEIKAALPEGKTFMVSCHAYGAYRFPVAKMGEVDGFTFQQYGPQKTWFYYSSFVNSCNNFLNFGFPKDKVYLSYSTTTSGAYNASDAQVSTVITGIRNGLVDGDGYVPNDEYEKGYFNGNYYYFTGPTQTYKRAKYCVDNNLQGIFYWDMGNDVATSHKYSLVKYCSYGLNANVDSLVTKVDVNHYTGISDIKKDIKAGGLSITPNPAKDYVSVSLASGSEPRDLTVYNAAGACVKNEKGAYANPVNISGFSTGLYIVKSKSDDGEEYEGRLIVK